VKYFHMQACMSHGIMVHTASTVSILTTHDFNFHGSDAACPCIEHVESSIEHRTQGQGHLCVRRSDRI